MKTLNNTEESRADAEIGAPVRVRLDAAPGPVRELAELQAAHGLSDNAFADSVRLGYQGSSWGKIKAGTYDGNLEKALRRVRVALTRATEQGLDPAAGRFVMFEHVRGVLAGVEMARLAVNTPNRLVVYVAGMGMGKSELVKYLAREKGAVTMEGQPSWGSSYMASLLDMATALGVNDRLMGRHAAETAILNTLRSNPRLLAVDEANYFTTDGLSFIKAILNQTQSVVVLCTLPDDFARWKAENRHQSRQLVRRAVSVMRAPNLSARDVLSIQAAGWPELHVNGAAPKIAAAANLFGGLDFVVRVLEEADPQDVEDTEQAITRVQEILAEGVK